MILLLAPIFLYAALGLGRSVFKALRISSSPEEELLFSAMLGLGIAAYGVLGTGLLGILSGTALAVLMGIFFLIALWQTAEIQRLLKAVFERWAAPADKGLLFFSAVTGIAVLAGLLAPETANDSLCYHLHLPKVFLMQGWIGRVPYEINSLFPFLMEMLYTLGLAFHSVPLAKFFHLATGILTCLGIVACSRRSASSLAAWAAGLLFLTTPGIVNQLPSTYVDVGFTAYSFFTVFAFLRWLEERQQGWLVLSGLLMGLTLSIKYLGAISLFAVGLWMVLAPWTQKKSFSIRDLFLFLGAAAVAGGYWYLRAWIEWGNPVYPYFAWLFQRGDPTIHYDDIGVRKTLANFLQVPWTLTMAPYRFEGYGNNLGPAYLAWVPGLWLLPQKRPGLGFLGFYSLFYLGCWFLLGQSLRFLFPVLPILAVLTAYAIDSSMKIAPKGIVKGLLLLVLAMHTGLALYHYRGDFRHALGRESTDAYLERMERTYPAGRYIGKHLPDTAKILMVNEVRLFYIPRQAVREDLYARDSAYFQKSPEAAGVLAHLRAQGFTHLLYTNDREPKARLPPLRVSQILQDPQNILALSLSPLYTYEFKEPDGFVRTYTLFEL